MQNNLLFLLTIKNCKEFSILSQKDKKEDFFQNQIKKYQKYLQNPKEYFWLNEENGKVADPTISKFYALKCLNCEYYNNCRKLLYIIFNMQWKERSEYNAE